MGNKVKEIVLSLIDGCVRGAEVSAFVSGSSHPGCLVFLGKTTHIYKRVPANLMLGVTL